MNFDFPRNIEEYVHRVGRTGRAGKTGTSITFVERRDRKSAQELIKILKGTWPMSSLHNVNKQLSFFKNVNNQLSLFKNVNKQLSFLEKCKQTAVKSRLDMGHVPSSSTSD